MRRNACKLVTMTVFINDPRYGDEFVKVRGLTSRTAFPASALITVSGFCRARDRHEIQGGGSSMSGITSSADNRIGAHCAGRNEGAE